MKKQIDLKKLSEAMEKECVGWETEEGLSEETRKQLLEKVMEAEIQKEAKRLLKREKKRVQFRYVVCTVLVLVLVMGISVFGERIWCLQGTNHVQDGELSTNISTGEQGDILVEEEEMYREIKETLGIAPMRLGHLPEGMVLEEYKIAEVAGVAYVNYSYEGKYIYIRMKKIDEELEGEIQWDGNVKKLDLDQEEFVYHIEAYCVDLENNNYGAIIQHENAYYDIQGRFEDENIFLEILYGIYFENL